MKTINILGETQREQWHSVVNMLRQLGGDLTREGRSELCDELDRYIDAMEDANEAEDEPRKVFALICWSYVEAMSESDVKLFESVEDAMGEMARQYGEMVDLWKHDVGVHTLEYDSELTEYRASLTEGFDSIWWRIEEQEVRG